jgi:ketosteroid isomerase-like protein
VTTPKEIVDRWVAAYNARDWAAYKDILSPDCVIDVGSRRLQGIQQVIEDDQSLAEACPDVRAVNLREAVSGPLVMREDRATGTFTKPWHRAAGDISPTGKRFDVTFAVVIEVEDGRVVAGRFYSDPAIFGAQLGIS